MATQKYPTENGLYLVSATERQDPRHVARWEDDHWRTVGVNIEHDNSIPDGNVVLWAGPLVPRPPLDKLRSERVSDCHIRDYFAGQALAGILACNRDYEGARTIKDRVILAYEYADAMLQARTSAGAQP